MSANPRCLASERDASFRASVNAIAGLCTDAISPPHKMPAKSGVGDSSVSDFGIGYPASGRKTISCSDAWPGSLLATPPSRSGLGTEPRASASGSATMHSITWLRPEPDRLPAVRPPVSRRTRGVAGRWSKTASPSHPTEPVAEFQQVIVDRAQRRLLAGEQLLHQAVWVIVL